MRIRLLIRSRTRARIRIRSRIRIVAGAVLFASAAACAPAPQVAVARVREVGTLQSPHVVGRDGGQSVRAGDVDVWVFGDTFVDVADKDGSTFHSSSSAQTNDFDAKDGISPFDAPLDDVGSPLPFLDATADERAFNLAHQSRADGSCAEKPCGARNVTWPGTSVDLGGTFATFYEKIHAEPGDFNFSGTGASLATWQHAGDRPVRVEPPLFSAQEPAYGSAAVVDDGFLFSFACNTDDLSCPCTLARVPVGALTDRSAWRFWNGNDYVADLRAATSVVGGGAINSVQRRGDGWLALFDPAFSNDVIARTSSRLEGPWSDPVKLFVANHGDGGGTYDAHIHVELGDDETLIISNSRSDGTPFGSVTALTEVDLR
jgi:hypothetical protein